VKRTPSASKPWRKSSPLHPITPSSALCPLCDQELDLTIADDRVAAKWRTVLTHRHLWAEVAEQFRACQSIEVAAEALSITPELSETVLQFLCTEICGCRRVTCVSCLDDYRNLL
jgi:hypothetical protein